MDSSASDPALAPLTGAQRKHLRGLANPRKALVQVGEGGLSDSIIRALDKALLDHELVKVRLFRPDDKKGDAQTLAERSGAHLCGPRRAHRDPLSTPSRKAQDRTARLRIRRFGSERLLYQPRRSMGQSSRTSSPETRWKTSW